MFAGGVSLVTLSTAVFSLMCPAVGLENCTATASRMCGDPVSSYLEANPGKHYSGMQHVSADDTVLLQARLRNLSSIQLGTPDDNATVVDIHEDNSSLEIKLENLAGLFLKLDLDGSGHLDVEELRHGLFAQAKLEAAIAGGSLNHSADSLRASQDEVEDFVRVNSKHGVMSLTLQEFQMSLDSTVHARGNVAAVQTLAIDKCVESWAEQEWTKNGCVNEKKEKECWKSWEIWKGDFWECRWNTVTVLVDCAVDIVKTGVAGFDDCFKNILKEVKKEATHSLKVFADLIPKDCDSVDSCRRKLLNTGQTLLDEIKKSASSLFHDLLRNDKRLRDGHSFAQRVGGKLPGVLSNLGPVVTRSGQALVKFFKGSLSSIHKIASQMNFCTPRGFFSFSVTDCGAFNQLKKLFEQVWKAWEIEDHFDKVVAKFGTCLTKRELFTLPTPFLQVSVQQWCLPQFMQVPMKGIVGAFIYFTKQLKAAGSSCSGRGSEEPICELVQNIKSIGNQLAAVLTEQAQGSGKGLKIPKGPRIPKALDQIAATVGKTGLGMNGSSKENVYRADCMGEDFKLFVEVGVGITIPDDPPPKGRGSVTFAAGFEVMSGCREKKPFVDLVFGLGVDRGFLATPEGAPEPGSSYSLGFEVDTPQKDIVDFATQAKMIGTVDLKHFAIPLPAEGSLELGFKVLPELDHPKGFKLTVAPKLDADLLQAKVNEATSGTGSDEERFGSALGIAIEHLAESGIQDGFSAALPESQKSMQAGAIAMNQMGNLMRKRGAARDSPIDLAVGIEAKFCLTCHLWQSDAAAGNTVLRPDGRDMFNTCSRCTCTGSNLKKCGGKKIRSSKDCGVAHYRDGRIEVRTCTVANWCTYESEQKHCIGTAPAGQTCKCSKGKATPITEYIEEGQGECRSGHEVYRSRAWELASSSGGRKDFSTSEYRAWVADALHQCRQKNPKVEFVSVWKDAGYRCYTGSTCSPSGNSHTKSWKATEYIEEGQGECRSGHEVYRSRAWELASSSGGRKDFSTSEYRAWVADALHRCIQKNPKVEFVSIWKDAGYRCYTGSTCSPSGTSHTKSWKKTAKLN